MTQLVHHDVIGEPRREERDLIIKVQIFIFRTTAPTGFLVFDKNVVKRKSIHVVKIPNSLDHQCTGRFFVSQIILVCQAGELRDGYTPIQVYSNTEGAKTRKSTK